MKDLCPEELRRKLISQIEEALHRKIATPKDFRMLGERIFHRLNIYISPTTLKRMWGYLKEDTQPRTSTFDILSRFIGYDDWQDFCQREGHRYENESYPVMARRISVLEDLNKGDRILLTWQPDRECLIEHQGDNRFQVISSANTRLKAGNTFCCSLIIEGEPLYIDHLQQQEGKPTAYICGKKAGIRFQLLPK